MSFMASALPSLIGGVLSAFGPNSGAQRQQLAYQKQVMQNQLGIMNQLRQYANSPVGSDPMEQAQWADSRAGLGEQQAQQQQQALAGYNMNQGMNGIGDFRNNMNSNFTAQQMALNAQNLLQAMQQRRQSLLQSAQVGASVPNFQPPSNGLPEIFGSLAQAYAYNQNRPKPGSNPWGFPTPGAGGVNLPLPSPRTTSTPYGNTSLGRQAQGDFNDGSNNLGYGQRF